MIGFGAAGLRADAPAVPATWTVDEAVQSDLAALAAPGDAAQRANAFERLQKMADQQPAHLVRQFVWYQSRARGERASHIAGAVIAELNLPKATVVAATLPLLESNDPLLVEQAGNVLGGYENRSAGRPPDFSTYRERIARARRNAAALPRGLVAYMYRSHPGAGLLTMMRAMGVREPSALKEILWGEHQVAEVLWKWRYGFLERGQVDPAAQTELKRLSRHTAWWVRLYVVAIMEQHAALRDAAVLERLRNDTDPQVAGIAARTLGETR
jgi:hypothetical protein